MNDLNATAAKPTYALLQGSSYGTNFFFKEFSQNKGNVFVKNLERNTKKQILLDEKYKLIEKTQNKPMGKHKRNLEKKKKKHHFIEELKKGDKKRKTISSRR